MVSARNVKREVVDNEGFFLLINCQKIHMTTFQLECVKDWADPLNYNDTYIH